jgi:hypothetical protein
MTSCTTERHAPLPTLMAPQLRRRAREIEDIVGRSDAISAVALQSQDPPPEREVGCS